MDDTSCSFRGVITESDISTLVSTLPIHLQLSTTYITMASARSLMALTSSFGRLAVRPAAPMTSFASPIASTSRLTLQSTFRPFSSTPPQSATMRQGELACPVWNQLKLTNSHPRMPSETSWSHISQTPSPFPATRSRSST